MPTFPELKKPSDPDNYGAGPLAGLLPEEPLKLEGDIPAAEPEPPKTETKYVTSLKLPAVETPEGKGMTPDQLTKYALERMDEVMQEMGLDSDWRVTPDSWMGMRDRFLRTYENDRDWRTVHGGVFATTNFTLGSCIRHVRYLSSRIQDDLFGTEPFFAAMGKNQDKAKLAKQAEEWVQKQIEKSPVRKGLRAAQKTALIVNEATVKTTWVKQASPYRGSATVAVDATGQPIKTPEKGLYIFENDNFLPSPNQPEPAPLPPVNGVNLPALPAPTPVMMVLEKDPSFEADAATLKFQPFPDLPQTLVLYEGPTTEPLDFRTFLCPLDAPTVHQADFNAHLYLESPLKMRSTWGDVDVGQRYYETMEAQAKTKQGENNTPPSSKYQRMRIAEIYLRVDADGDGEEEEIFMVVDVKNQKAIFYDYLKNHFDARPFDVIVGVERTQNRWWGRGVISLVDDQAWHQDLEYNRASQRGSRSSTVTFRYRNACEEWANGGATIIGGDAIYDVNEGYDRENRPPIWSENLSQPNDKALEIMEITRQASDALVGAISPADASQSDMNQSETATGIVNLQNAGDSILKANEQDQIEDINPILWKAFKLTLKNAPSTILMLSKDTSELVTLNKDEIASLEHDVKLTLTRSRSTQMQQVSATAIEIGIKYHEMMLAQPQVARDLRPLFLQQLKGLEVNEADEICPEVTDQDIQAFNDAQAAAAQAQQLASQPPAPEVPAAPMVKVSMADLVGTERAQALAPYNIQADEAAFTEKQAKDEAEAAAELNEKPSKTAEQPAGDSRAAA